VCLCVETSSRCISMASTLPAMAALLLLCLGVCAGQQANSQATMSQLNLNAGHEQAAQVRFGQGSHVYSVGAKKTGFFIEYQEEDVMSIDTNGNVVFRADVMGRRFQADDLILGKVPQWKMVALEIFSRKSPVDLGWFAGDLNTPTLNCSGLVLVTGATGPQKVAGMDSYVKHYEALPPHDQIRIQATVHFIDDWQGETAYMKLGEAYVWTDSHDQRSSRGNFNVCGGKYPDSKFSVPIDVTISHNSDDLRLAFGSTLDQTAVAAFGMSSVSVSVRSLQ